MKKILFLLMTISIIIIFISAAIASRKSTYKETFCQFFADAGMVCPIRVNTDEYDIVPYIETSNSIKEQVIKHMEKEWKYDHDHIMRNWTSGGSVFYVMYSGNQFIGCVSIDRKQFYPYIGNLYVVPDKRKSGYASVLLRLAEDYTELLSFNDSRLWCESHLIEYYEKRGYTIEEKKTKYILCLKN